MIVANAGILKRRLQALMNESHRAAIWLHKVGEAIDMLEAEPMTPVQKAEALASLTTMMVDLAGRVDDVQQAYTATEEIVEE